MADTAGRLAAPSPIIENLVQTMSGAMMAVEAFYDAAKSSAAEKLVKDGKPDRTALTEHQHLAHGLAWLATYVETLRETANWAQRLEEDEKFGETEALLSQILFGRYLADLASGIPMNQGEIIRPHEFGLTDDWTEFLEDSAVEALIDNGLTPASMAAAAALLPDSLSRATAENTGLDETMNMVRDQFRKFANDKVVPYAHDWHLKNEYIPMPVVEEMGELGVFGLTIPKSLAASAWTRLPCVSCLKNCRAGISVWARSARARRSPLS